MPGKSPLFRFIALLIAFTLCSILSFGCLPGSTEDTGAGAEGFDQLMDELFAQWVSSDSLTLNCLLAYPESYGIEKPDPPTFGGVVSSESTYESIQEDQDLFDRLEEFRYEDLRSDQQIIYDILVRELEISGIMDSNEDFLYYLGYICPLNGIQVQLPILLAEYSFNTADDIELYLQLLEDTRRYFDEIIAFERERAKRGFFMSDANADTVIDHCDSFLSDRDDHFLISIFNDRIDQYAGLNVEQREQYKLRNRDLILGNVLPAYEVLLEAMRDLRGVGSHRGGLADLPNGEVFSQAYLRYKTGSDKTPAQVDTLLEKWLNDTIEKMVSLNNQYPYLWDGLSDGTSGAILYDTPENYLSMLEKNITGDFPAIGLTQYVVREVHDSLQEYVSPAFYLTPALDRFDNNTIYINPGDISDNLYLFTTLAHEGYPGHLYQTVYYLQQSPHPIRSLLDSLGYVEGWATYAELRSYSFTDLDEHEAQFMQYYRLLDILFASRIDLGVNALGWGVDQVALLCAGLGIEDREVVEELYETVIGNPLLYLPYSLGYIEISQLLEEAEWALGSNFELLEFHRFLLDFGAAPFPLIREHMMDWVLACLSTKIAQAA